MQNSKQNSKKRTPSLDSMITYFLNQYELATKKDINRLIKKIDELEKVVTGGKPAASKTSRTRSKNAKSKSASEQVLAAISEIGYGANFSEIQAKTQFEEKKLRNIIYRLTKQGKIRRKQRGIYVPV